MPKAVRRAVIAGLLVIVAIATWRLTSLPSEPSPPASQYRPVITPGDKDSIPRQGQIMILLPSGNAGTLTVNQRAIPDAQLNRNKDPKVASSQQLIFQPGKNKVFESFAPGQNCASFVYWRVDTPDQRFTENWCFTAA